MLRLQGGRPERERDSCIGGDKLPKLSANDLFSILGCGLICQAPLPSSLLTCKQALIPRSQHIMVEFVKFPKAKAAGTKGHRKIFKGHRHKIFSLLTLSVSTDCSVLQLTIVMNPAQLEI